MVESTHEIAAVFSDAGFDVTPLTKSGHVSTQDLVFLGVISGGILAATHALVRANEDVCRVLSWIKYPPGLESDDRLRISEGLLRLNFTSAFGRVSATPEDSTKTKVPDFIYLETVFFWQYLLTDRVRFVKEIGRRMEGFARLGVDVIELLAKPAPEGL